MESSTDDSCCWVHGDLEESCTNEPYELSKRVEGCEANEFSGVKGRWSFRSLTVELEL